MAVVTGGGRGIGAGVARAFAEHGARVAVVDVDGGAAERTCEEIRRSGGEAAAWACDVRDEGQVEKTVGEVAARFGKIDVLFNNAGINRRAALFEYKREDWGAVAAMTRDLAAEWAAYGVRVNAVAPGWIRTEMNAPLLANETAARRVVERVPMGRWGEVEDVVGPVLFLASEAARYVTGHLIPIDGGAASIIRLTSDEVIR